MNYVWEVLLEAEKEGIHRDEIRFVPAEAPSPYVEVSFAELNTVSLSSAQIEVNPLYRFNDIFSGLFAPDISEYRDTRAMFLDVLMHYMAETDLLSGMHKQEYFHWFLTGELERGTFGEKAKEAFELFEIRERRVIVNSLLSLYGSAHYRELFRKLMRELYEDSIIYEGRDRAESVFLYVGKKETEAERRKVQFLVDTFLPLNEDVEIFYDRHFGIVDVEETMVMDKVLVI